MKAEGLIKKFKAYPFAFAIIVLAVGLIGFTFFRSMGNRDLEARYQQAVRTWNKIDVNVFKNSVNLESDLETANLISQDVQNRLIHPPELAKNYQYFFRLESATDVKISSLQQETLPTPAKKKNEKSKEKPLFSNVPYTMGVNGEFAELVLFLYALENGEHFYRVNECTLQRNPRSEGQKLSMVMKFELLGTP